MTINKIVFIGAGNMSGAIIEGMIASGVSPESIHTTNRSDEKCQYWRGKGLTAHQSNIEALQDAEVVVLGVKPNMMNDLLSEISSAIPERATVISVAAGVPYNNYRHFLPTQTIVRTMPNTPCLVGTGVVGAYYGDQINEATVELIESLFNPIAMVHTCQTEDEIDLVIAAAGSAPAYFFLFIESIINAAERLGLEPEAAAKMVKQTALGAAQMAVSSTDTPQTLRRNVTSPGGTTHEAVVRFQNDGLEQMTEQAMRDCIARAKEMAAQLTLNK